MLVFVLLIVTTIGVPTPIATALVLDTSNECDTRRAEFKQIYQKADAICVALFLRQGQ